MTSLVKEAYLESLNENCVSSLLSFNCASSSLSFLFADDGKRQSMLYYLPDEVNDKVRDAIDTIEEPVKVIFEDSRCDDCGVVGDKRLLPDFCHMEKTYQHPQPLKHFHSQDLQ